jgi:hypothetical protein
VLACLNDGELTYAQRNACVEQKVGNTFQGSITWHAERLKTDTTPLACKIDVLQKRLERGQRHVYLGPGTQ